jgi:hypothetical protein
MYKSNLMLVIKYLKGEIDIYDGKHENVIMTWNNAWDEMNWMGYNPQTVEGIQKYIKEQL